MPKWLHCFDPGVTTGYAVMDYSGANLDMHQFTQGELFEFLINEDFNDSIVIIEDYKIFHGKQMAHTMTRLVTAEMIGAIRLAVFSRANVVMQTPQNKQMGYKWMGMKPYPDHNQTHQWDALAHGIYYLVVHKHIDPPARKKLKSYASFSQDSHNV